MRVTLRNDGKKKRYSFEAKLLDAFCELEGYGENEKEAIAECKKCVEARIKALQPIKYGDPIWVDCLGKMIKKSGSDLRELPGSSSAQRD